MSVRTLDLEDTVPSSSSPSQVYQVPIVFQNLRAPESYGQIFDSLENLNNIVDGIFSRLTTKISSEHNKMKNVSTRISLAKSKIKQLQDSSRPITVLSPNRFPANSICKDYEPVFSDNNNCSNIKHSSYNIHENPKIVASSTAISDDIISKEINPREVIDDSKVKEGLGRLPNEISSVSNLILFNSSENPYRKYSTLDNLAGNSENVNHKEKKQKVALTEAPKSFTGDDTIEAVRGLNYRFEYATKALPEMKVPSNLDLPNVANLNYNTKFELITPSYLIPELPNLEKNEISPVTTSHLSNPVNDSQLLTKLDQIDNSPDSPSKSNGDFIDSSNEEEKEVVLKKKEKKKTVNFDSNENSKKIPIESISSDNVNNNSTCAESRPNDRERPHSEKTENPSISKKPVQPSPKRTDGHASVFEDIKKGHHLSRLKKRNHEKIQTNENEAELFGIRFILDQRRMFLTERMDEETTDDLLNFPEDSEWIEIE